VVPPESAPNGISIGPVVSARLTLVSNRQTDRQTDKQTTLLATAVAIDRIYTMHVMRLKNYTLASQILPTLACLLSSPRYMYIDDDDDTSFHVVACRILSRDKIACPE